MTTSTMMTKKMLRKKKRIGNSPRSLLRTLALGALLVLLLPVVSLPKDKEKAKKPESYSLVAGTVFRPPGFALPGAEVTLKPEKGKGQQKMTANMRGEFAFRVPSVFARYTVIVKASGFQQEEKSTEVGIDQRVDLPFELKPVVKR